MYHFIDPYNMLLFDALELMVDLAPPLEPPELEVHLDDLVALGKLEINLDSHGVDLFGGRGVSQ